MKATEPVSSPRNLRRHKYQKVLDGRKQPIRNLYRRNGNYLARITVEGENGRKKIAWLPLVAGSVADAQGELRRVLTEREDNDLRHVGRSPRLEDYITKTYLPYLDATGKKHDTIVTEKSHVTRWRNELGHLRLDKIRPTNIQSVLSAMRKERAARTCNGAWCALSNIFKQARQDGFIKASPLAGIVRFKTEQKQRPLITWSQIESLCNSALISSKNGQQLSDYLRFLAFSGAREQEALRIRWEDVNFDQGNVCVGADGDTKNRSRRFVDMNAKLKSHLLEMKSRRAPDTVWLFPSPQRGNKDRHADTFRESMKLARTHAKLLQFGFHDFRHFFVSHAVMSGVDFLTLAKWVGHKDGGLLIGKVYGHLSEGHSQKQAERVNFS